MRRVLSRASPGATARRRPAGLPARVGHAGRLIRVGVGACLVLTAGVGGCSSNRVVVRQGPVAAPDPAPLPATLVEREPGKVSDFLEHSVLRPALHTLNPPATLRRWVGYRTEAYDLTAEDDVQAPAWFVPRNTSRRMTPAEVAAGPLPGGGPDTTGTLTVIRAKVQGITPGFTIRDREGAEFLVKFDPPEYPELSSAAEVIGGRLFHAAGYHVPATFITVLDRSRLVVAPGVTYRDSLGRPRQLTGARVDELLDLVANLPDGRVRAVASRILPGTPIGPFDFHGRREEDPADTIPHQHRRALRGLYVMAAWLNHVDIRQHNTLDMVVEEEGRRFVRHHLIDFGSSLGSASLFPNIPRDGVEYDLDLTSIFARMLTLNLYAERWERYGGGVRHPSVGFYSADLFDPGSWTTDYPNPAFRERSTRDAYWGAKLVASFTGEQIRAAVEAGQLSDPEAEAYLLGEILERREMTLRHWLPRVTPLEEPRLETRAGAEGPALGFRDLAATHGLLAGDRRAYRTRLSLRAAGVESGRRIDVSLDAEGRGSLPLDLPDPAAVAERVAGRPLEERIAKLEITAVPEDGAPDPRSVRFYLFPDPDTGWRVVGRAY